MNRIISISSRQLPVSVGKASRQGNQPLRRYATPSEPAKASKSNAPWIATGLALTGVGTYVALAPEGSKAAAHKEHAKDKAHEAKEKLKSAAEQAHERERERDAERGPKPNPDANSEERHAGHAETNEKKVRKGKFSGQEFDNHVTSHSGDPGKDFEVLKKEGN